MTGIYAENAEGIFKKSVLEAASYASRISNGNVVAVCIGQPNEGEAEKLSQYGIDKLLVIEGMTQFDSQAYTLEIAKALSGENIQQLVIANTYEGKSLAPRLAVAMNASLATNVVELPDTSNGFTVKRGVFSGKGFAFVDMLKN